MSCYEAFLAALNARGLHVTRDGVKAMAQCPGHGDRKASLSVTLSEEGRVLVHCHAGCDTAAILDPLGLDLSDLFERPGVNGRDPVAVYTYTDEAGVPLFEVGRFPGKKFFQRRPGRSDWKGGIRGVRRVLYRLPQVLEAVKAGRVIWITEGEADVHALERAGEVATCNPGGAGKWKDEFSECLRGATVVTVADRDDRGREQARAIKRSLENVDAKVRIVEAAAGKDARDHLSAGHGLDEFWAIDLDEPDAGEPNEAALEIRRVLLQEAQDTRAGAGPAREEVPGTGGLIHRGVSAMIFSERGEGKTTAAVLVGLSAAAAGAHVLYLDRENGLALTRERTDAILDAHPEWGDPLADERFVGRHYPELRSEWRGEDFGEAIAGAGFTLVIFDSTREMLDQLGLDPNSDANLSTFHALAVTPLRRRGVAVVLLDNVGHTDTHRPKGSGTKLDAAEQAYKVVTISRFSALETGRVAITCVRSRYGDEGREWSMRVGGEVWELPHATTEAPDSRRARETSEGREAFRRACVAALEERRPLGRDVLIAAARSRGCKGRNEKLRDWLGDLAADPSSGIEATPHGYDLVADCYGPETPGHSGATPADDPPGRLAPPLRGARAGDSGPDQSGHKGASRATGDAELGIERAEAILQRNVDLFEDTP